MAQIVNTAAGSARNLVETWQASDGRPGAAMHYLFAPIDPASIAVFRILFGAIMMWEVARYFAYGWIDTHFIEPGFFFTYPGFHWVRPWPGAGMHSHFAGLGLLAFLIAIGFCYRAAMALFFIGFTYVFLIDQARYLNHFYLIALISFLMILVPASRIWSVDAWLAGAKTLPQIPAWTLLVLCAQVEIMYLYAGLMKIDRDWLQLEPLRQWLAGNAGLPVIGPLLLDDTVVAVAAYGSIVLHLAGAPLLLFRPTRLWVFLTYCAFHGLNSLFWNIGVFPWVTIAATLLFFPPDWPRQLALRLGLRATRMLTSGSAATVPRSPSLILQGATAAFVSIWIVVQITVPLRFLRYPGFVSWHEQGHQFSWQMMLRDKNGDTLFHVHEPSSGCSWLVEPIDYLTERQAQTMAGRPEMIRLFAHYLERIWTERRGTRDVEVRALTAVSLNGRSSRPLVDPRRDLTRIGFEIEPADWILPLTESLPPRNLRWPDDMTDALRRLAVAEDMAGLYRALRGAD
jgi:hypothetical protein